MGELANGGRVVGAVCCGALAVLVLWIHEGLTGLIERELRLCRRLLAAGRELDRRRRSLLERAR